MEEQEFLRVSPHNYKSDITALIDGTMTKSEYRKIDDYEDGFDIRDGVPDEKYMPKVEPARFCWRCHALLVDDNRCPNCGAQC